MVAISRSRANPTRARCSPSVSRRKGLNRVSDAQDLRARLEALRAESIERIEQVSDLAALEEARVRILGRKAPLSEIRSGLGKLEIEDRKTVGQLANEVQSA